MGHYDRAHRIEQRIKTTMAFLQLISTAFIRNEKYTVGGGMGCMESSDGFHLIALYLLSICMPFYLGYTISHIFPEARSRIHERTISLRFRA
jgi:hypothetical protein